ncbi:MAG TPA: hypothetical protein DEA22_00265, partial [Blastocatellia bacterium]|nr:hypothetical protein [Blastocatellia bacterium]
MSILFVVNKGKICISIQAQNAAEFFDKIARARPLADIVEARFDSLPEAELKVVLSEIFTKPEKISGRILATFRPGEEGGFRTLTLDERLAFWNSGITEMVWGIDLEIDIAKKIQFRKRPKIICSHHDFEKVPDDPAVIYEKLRASGADILKIAARIDDASDAVPLWKLVDISSRDGMPIVPIAMGEAGKWTRILGNAYGSPFTYAALDTGDAAAPGQIDAEEMDSIYRIKSHTRATSVFGLLAGDTAYSLSPFIHNAAFDEAGMDAVFVPFQTGRIDTFFRRFLRPETREIDINFKGFAVTNPLKRDVIPHLHGIDDAASAIGAVNTVAVTEKGFWGYNTDAQGFIEPLKAACGEIKGARAAIIGNGGAARAVIYALKAQGAETTVLG